MKLTNTAKHLLRLALRRSLTATLSLLGSTVLLAQTDVTQPGDPIVGSSSNTPAQETPDKAIDNNTGTKYLNFDKVNTGFTVTPSQLSLVTGLALTSANDADVRDPASYTVEGSTDAGANWTLISTGAVNNFTARFQRQVINFANTESYTSYRVIFPTVRDEVAANSMQIAEVELLGVKYTPGPASIVEQPANQTIREGLTTVFNVIADGTPYLTYQWYSNGVAVVNATNMSYTTPATTFEMNGTVYTVAVTNDLNGLVSGDAILTVTQNPVILSAGSRGNPDGIFVIFSKNVSAATALNPDNYEISGGVLVDDVAFAPVVGANGAESAVLLSVSPTLVNGANYTVTVTGIQDGNGVIMDPNPTITAFTHNAGGFTTDFSSGLPAGSQTFGVAAVADGVMKITSAVGSQSGDWIINDFTGGAPISRFTARWDARVGGGSDTPADGYSFNFASDLPNGGLGEEGAGSGLTIAFDIYDNGGGEAPAIDIKFGGVTISHNLTRIMISTNDFYPVVVNLDSDGTLDVLYNNVVIVSNLVTGYTPRAGRFGWGGRTGGLHANQWLDNVAITTYEAGPVFVENQPGDTTVLESRLVSWTVVGNGTPPYRAQWFSNNVAIPGATNLTYQFQPTRFANEAVYGFALSNEFSGTLGTNFTLTVITDATPPTFTATGSATFNTIRLQFSEEINPATVTVGNITVKDASNNELILSGVGVVDGDTIIITNETPQVAGTVYTVEITGLADIAGVPNTTTASANFTGFVFTPGFVLFQSYDGGTGTAVSTLTNQANFPNNPTLSRYITAVNSRLVFPNDDKINYGARFVGYFIPPTNGDYRFYISSDDLSHFYLSPNENPADKQLIVDLTQCCQPFTSFVSPPQTLVAGNRYYFEYLYKEQGGGDYAQANLTGNDAGRGSISAETIRGSLIGVYADPDAAGTTTIVQQPVNQLRTENEFVSFSVVATNTAGQPFFYQWRKNGAEIPGANSATYTEGPLSLDDDGDYFDVIVYVPGASVVSDPATNTVRGDIIPPQVVAITMDPSLRQLNVIYSELMDQASAEDSANYMLDDASVNILNRTLNNGSNVVLTLDRALTPDTSYTLNILSVYDLIGNPIAGDEANGTNVTFTTWSVSRGFVQYDFWLGIGGGAVSDLLNNPRYPVDNVPSQHVTYFTNNVNWPQTSPDLNDYGLRMSGFFIPTVSGTHTFYLRYDDGARMQLSTDETAANLATIFSSGCCNGDNPPTQASTPVELVAGQRYYFEAIVKEAGGGDYLGIGFRGPGDTTTRFIPPQNLAVVTSPAGAPVGGFAQQPGSISIEANHSTMLSVVFTNSGNLPAQLQWQSRAGGATEFTDIPGATGNTFTTPALVVGDSGVQYRAVAYLPGNTVASAAATVTVVEDVTLPLVLSVGSAIGTNVGVAFNETLDPASAEEETNYSIGGQNPDSAVLRPDGKSVQLTFSGGFASPFTIEIENVADAAGNLVQTTNLTSRIWLEGVVDIGGPLPPGEHFSWDEGAIEIKAGGNDVWGTGGDQFTFGYVQRTNDFDVKVRIDSLAYVGNSWSKAGLNVRESTNDNSRSVWFYPTPKEGANAFEGMVRTNNGSGHFDFGQPRPATYFPAWLRVQRVGDEFTAYLSTDGTDWTVFGSPLNLPEFPATLMVGMGAVSHVQGTHTTVVFGEFGDFVGAPTLSISREGDNIVIRWEGDGVLESTTELPGGWTEVEGATSPYTVPTNLPERYFRIRE